MTNISKTNVVSSAVKKTNAGTREFIGKAWINTIKQGKLEGTQFINLTLDNTIQEVTLAKGTQIQLWPNKKREGQNNDADYRLSIVVPIV